ncbi:MAG: Gldg family protein [Planctomycetes bacterium]|nr:Gldg family protein [Planctomycetota bacterium]
MRFSVVWAVLRRDFVGYFTSLTGYVFITLFIGMCSFLQFWQDEFFHNNLANLSTLNVLFPVLLLFIVPAITMSAWADERRQGVDELLLTLPVSDLELVAGKYLGALGIYTVSLGFSLTLLGFLSWLGRPDAGLIFANYYAFWLLGAALLAIGMVGSVLTDNLTVGFILGAALCAVPVFLDRVGQLLGNLPLVGKLLGRWCTELGASPRFEEMTRGVVPASGVLYFLVVTGVFFYINLVLVGRRRWRVPMFGLHLAARASAALIAGISLVILMGRTNLRADCTAEGLHSLTKTTKEIILQIDPQNPVLIQAYVSKTVPRNYVETRENLLNLLREYAAIGGERVRLNVIETEKFSDQAREAEERFQIRPVQLTQESGGRSETIDVFLGIAVTCGADEVVTPFFFRGLPIEYELSRSVRTVSRPVKAGAEGEKSNRLKVGVLDNDVKPFGGFDFQTMGSQPQWEFIEELRRQYQVVQVPVAGPYPPDLALLIVIQPSSLTQPQMQSLTKWIHDQKPTLLLDDPFPRSFAGSPPSEKQKGGSKNPFQQGAPPPEEKGNFGEVMMLCGIRWDTAEVAWDMYNPHPEYSWLDPEFVFTGAGNGAKDAFNPNELTTAGLQEVLTIFPGCIEARGTPGANFIPLLTTGKNSGTLLYEDILEKTFFGQRFKADRKHVAGTRELTLAARASGSVNVIFIADVDFISQAFFDMRRENRESLELDNVTFFLNCVDQLAGDESFIELRKRRRKHRTLERLEAKERIYDEQRLKDVKEATEAAEKKLKDANDRLKEGVEEINKRTDLDPELKRVMMEQKRQVEQKRVDEETKKIDDEKGRAIDMSKARSSTEIKKIQDSVRLLSTLLPPIPPLLIGLIIFFVRIGKERGLARGDRWVGGGKEPQP